MSKDKKCPLTRKTCMEHECEFYIQLQGVNPNTGQPVDKWGCAHAWMPILLIESAKETRQAAAAIESFRNESVKDTDKQINAIAMLAQALDNTLRAVGFGGGKDVKQIEHQG